MRGGARDYNPVYRRRLERRLGMPIEEARRRGISFQAARGHRPREKAELEAKRRERGELSDTERRFLRDQLKKEARWRPLDEQLLRARRAREKFTAMSPYQRSQLMAAQRRLAAGYRARQRIVRTGWPRAGRIGGFVTSGVHVPYAYGSGEDEFEEWYEDEFPDLDEDSDLLLYYH